jgi:hypothetical protein
LKGRNAKALKKHAQNDFEETSDNDNYISFDAELFKLEAA